MDLNQKIEKVKQAVNLGIGGENRGNIALMLSQLLADEHVLYIKLRNYHWNIKGMHFVSLHAFFEEQYTVIAEQIDQIAERIRSVGFFTPGSMEDFRGLARLHETNHLNGDETQMLKNILADHEAIVQTLRSDLEDAADKYNDAGTSDFLTALMEEHEKMAWMVRSHLS